MLYHCDAAARYKVAGQAARPQKQEQDRPTPPHNTRLSFPDRLFLRLGLGRWPFGLGLPLSKVYCSHSEHYCLGDKTFGDGGKLEEGSEEGHTEVVH